MSPPKGRVLIKYTACLPACAAGPDCQCPGTVAQSTHLCPGCERHIHGICGIPNPDRDCDRPGDDFKWSQMCFRCADKRGLIQSIAKRRGRQMLGTYIKQEGGGGVLAETAPKEVSPSPTQKSSSVSSPLKKRVVGGPAVSLRVSRQKHEPKTPENAIAIQTGGNLGTKGGRKTCSFPGCGKFSVQNGVCYTHGANRKKCSDPGCTNWSVSGGVCYRHGAKRKKYKRS